MNILKHNRAAWDQEALKGNKWTIPATEKEISAARNGECRIVLTPIKLIPTDWLGNVRDKQVLCLASGGGQQGPILAAAGARVTVFDNSDEQLKRDSRAAETFSLPIKIEQGNMQDLSRFSDESFDLIIHPVSNCFIDDILPVWKECYRVLRSPGSLLAGFANPLLYMIDWEEADQSQRCEIKNPFPYSDVVSFSPKMMEVYLEEKRPLEFGHTLSDQIQGQITAGFLIAGLYEDKGELLLDKYTEVFIATKAVKL